MGRSILLKSHLDSVAEIVYLSCMTTTAEIAEITGRLAEFVRQVESGNEVLFIKDNRPVARLVPASEKSDPSGTVRPIRSLRGHRVLTPVISQAELAEEMFAHE